MDRTNIVRFSKAVAAIGRELLPFEEGMVSLKLILWTMEEIKARGEGAVTEEEVVQACDRLIREAESE